MFSREKNFLFIFFTISFLLKLIVLGLFSSDYQNNLFMPFVSYFVEYGHNPWQYIYDNALSVEFPYHPLMLYIYSIGGFFIKLFNVNNIFVQNILFKLPVIVADVSVFYLLLKIFKNKKLEVFIYYFLSPIIIYAAYIHSQLDLVPVAFLFLSFYYLKKKKIYQSSLVFALASCIKMNVVLFLPIFLIYLYKANNKRKTFISFLIICSIYLLISMPYIGSIGYQKLVLMNDKQNLFFNLFIVLGNIKIYIPLFIAGLIYLRFFAYKKINTELLDSYCVLTISLFLLFVPPSTPAWYIWLVPFLSLFVIRYSTSNKLLPALYWTFNFVYIVYFVFFHVGDYGDVTFLYNNFDFKINNIFIKNFIFTILEVFIVSIVYYIYKTGIKSNLIYKKNRAVVIGIGGDSGSGKSTLLDDIKSLLKNDIILLEGDADHKWERGDEHWKSYTHLNPKANFLYKQINDVVKLKKLEPVYRCDYNHNTGKFDPMVRIEPKSFIVLSGLHPFYLPKMRKIIDLKIYLNPDENLRKLWKINRDMNNRGYSKDEILASIEKRSEDSKKYIIPQRNFADLIISYFPISKIDLQNSPPPR